MRQALRVHNFFVSADGFGAGEGQSLERPFGHADPRELGAWAMATASWPNRTDPRGSRGLDDCFTRDFSRNIGAEIMGRNKFGPQRGPWQDEEWKGWWGNEPPFHTPAFLLTHHSRPFVHPRGHDAYFVLGQPADVLRQPGRRPRDGTCASAAERTASASSSTPTSWTPSTSRST